MEFTEKLRRCAASINKAERGRAAGLRATTISNYVAKGSIPRADIALKMARALNVPLDWLVDDAQDWPPPPISPASALSTDDLVEEVGNRMAGIAIAMAAKLNTARKVDWIEAATELLKIKPPAQPDARLRKLVDLPNQISVLESEIDEFDPWVDRESHAEPPFPLTLSNLLKVERELWDRPGYREMLQLSSLWRLRGEWVDPPDQVQQIIFGEVAARLEQMRFPKLFNAIPSPAQTAKRATKKGVSAHRPGQ